MIFLEYMKYIEDFKKLGLTKQEAAIYLFLLQNGLSSVAQIAKETKITPSNCYNLLTSLSEQQLIEESSRSKKKQFIARDPQTLLNRIESRREIAQRLIPDLRALYSIQKNKPTIRFFEGKEGIQEIYLETLNADRIFAVGSTAKLHMSDSAFFINYRKKVAEKNIVVYDILTPASADIARQTKEIMKGYYDSRLLPKNVDDVPADILVWGDNVALITLEEPIFGTIITQTFIAKTILAILDTLYRKL